MFYLYIIQSLKKHRYYIGVSQDIGKRLTAHNKGKTKSTRSYRPWKLFYSEEYVKKSNAYKREYYLKHPSGYIEKRMIINHDENIKNGIYC